MYHELVDLFGLTFGLVKVYCHRVVDERFDPCFC